MLVRDGLWVVEAVNDYGGAQVSDMTIIIELKDGRIWRDRRYYAEPFEAPELRHSGSSGWNSKLQAHPHFSERYTCEVRLSLGKPSRKVRDA